MARHDPKERTDYLCWVRQDGDRWFWEASYRDHSSGGWQSIGHGRSRSRSRAARKAERECAHHRAFKLDDAALAAANARGEWHPWL